jgi:hypothetical protein
LGGRKEKGILQRRGSGGRAERSEVGGALFRITTQAERTERYKATTRSARAKHADQSLRDHVIRASVMVRPQIIIAHLGGFYICGDGASKLLCLRAELNGRSCVFLHY